MLDPWQVLLVCMTLAMMAGRLAASTVGALVARQNGKGGWLEAVAIWSLFEARLTGRLTGRQNTTLWTAHELKTSDEAYARVVALIKANDDLAAEVVIWNGGLTGTHIIQLRDGSRLVFLARSKSSGRGFSPRRIIFDEAQEFSALSYRAMTYATSAQGARRQMIFTGTVPDESMDSTIWSGVRDRGRSGDPKRVAWAEWTPEGSDDPDAAIDPTSWVNRAAANPALDVRIERETVDDEYAAALALGDLIGFMRERMSVWPSLNAGNHWRVIDAADWAQCPATVATMVAPVVLSLEVSLDRTRAWLLAVGARDDGIPQIEPVPAKRDSEQFAFDGLDGVAARVAQVVAANTDVVGLAVDKFGGAMALVEDIEKAVKDIPGWATSLRKFEVTAVNGAQFVDASGQIEDAIRSSRIAHGGSPLLTAAAKQADVTEKDGARYFRRAKSGPDAGPFFALLVGAYAWRSARKPQVVAEIF